MAKNINRSDFDLWYLHKLQSYQLLKNKETKTQRSLKYPQPKLLKNNDNRKS